MSSSALDDRSAVPAPSEPMPRTGGLREAKKQATTWALVEAARRLVHEHDLDAVTVEDIAAAAGVSGRTFFNYFDTKEQAIIGPDAPLGSELARATFLAGGLNDGDLLADIVDLVDFEGEIQRQTRQGLHLAIDIIRTEPRVLAAQLSRVHRHENELADLIARRRGEPVTGPEDLSVAALALSLVGRAGFAWMNSDDTRDYATHFAATRAVGERLLAPRRS